MLSNLLTTKLHIPQIRMERVKRPHLVSRLQQGLDKKLILVSAPAGYGKTTLICEWLLSCNQPAAWVSLDKGDNDPMRFWRYIIAALQGAFFPIGKTLPDLLTHHNLPNREALLTDLVNELEKLQQPLILILDDYHNIVLHSIHEELSFLLEHAPANFQLVITTRTDPPLPLSRLRAYSQICELRLADLRFSNAETEEFLSKILGLRISKEDLAILEASTEGWIAGLQMAGLSLQNRGDISSYIRSFSGENRYTLDFLFDEIFQRQTEEVRNFLLQSSILERLSGSLCDHVLMRQDSKSILNFLERSNLFLIALDEQREWYRYHNLFQVLLQQQLKHIQSTSIPSIHLRASEWYERMGKLPQAINHAIESQDLDRSARLIELAADATLLNGEIKTLLNWVERLPEDVASQWPLLCVYHAEALLLTGKPMHQISKRLEGTPEYTVVEALKATYQGDVELCKRLSTQALGNLPKDSVFLRSVITSALGAVLLMSGNIESATNTFQESAAIARESGNLMFEIIALCRLGQLYKLKGELHKAEKITQQALELSTYRSGGYLSVASMPLMTLANLKYERNDLEAALDLIQKAIDLSVESGGFWSIDCYLVYSYVLQAQGNAEGALEAMRKARKIASQTEANRFDDIYSAAYEAQLNIAQGNLAEAFQWARAGDLTNLGEPEDARNKGRFSPDLFHLTELELMTLAKVYLAQEKPEKALDLLVPLSNETEKRGRTLSIVENLVLQARAKQIKGMTKEALNKLENALVLAEPIGYIRIFLNEGEHLQEMLMNLAAYWEYADRKDLARSTSLKRYVQRLISAFHRETAHTLSDGIRQRKPESDKVSPLNAWIIEPLSRRESEVLNLLVQGLSDKEIALSLTIASGTVHKHLKNIYSKLGVHNRTAAVTRALELGLL